MLEDYKKAVISDYHQKKENGVLSLNLSHPSPAKLRNECLLVLNARPNITDERIIKDFFNAGVASSDYSGAISRFDADKLKPLVNFLRGITADTEPINVELLAWLIDFRERPYKFGNNYSISPELAVQRGTVKELPNNGNANDINDSATIDKPSETSGSRLGSKITWKKVVPTTVLAFLLLGGGYTYYQSNSVYICDSGTARKYHLNKNCPSLGNCKSEVARTTIDHAKKQKRTLCGFED